MLFGRYRDEGDEEDDIVDVELKIIKDSYCFIDILMNYENVFKYIFNYIFNII